MESLFLKHDQYLQAVPSKIIRECVMDIDWDAPMISIRGAKGVGKSTLMLQYIRTHFPLGDRTVLYCSLDSVYFATHSLLDLASNFHQMGGRHLFLDEVHKYTNWSRELKEIYDLYPDIHLVISSSSLLNLFSGDSDLSRRCINYDIQGLSWREFLLFYKGISLPRYSLENIVTQAASICQTVNAVCSPIAQLQEYLQHGYYPYYLRYPKTYSTTIEQVVTHVIDNEMPQLCKVDPANCRKIKALMAILSSSEPFQVDITKMSILSGLQRNTVIEYLNYLSRAGLLNLLYSDLRNIKKMQKPDKIFVENSNLLYALASESIKIGTARETFVVNQLSYLHDVEYKKQSGDFLVDGKYTFEVGGADKSFKQIADIPNSFVLADNIEFPIGNKLPLWLIGLLY